MKIVISLGASSLPYASICIRSLADKLLGDQQIHLLTDSPQDQKQLQDAFADIARINVHWSDELWTDSGNAMRRFPGIVRLRDGHPCWRKLTDPMLLANDGDEVVVIDPDVYFFRPFAFEPVGDASLRLMWQRANCLLPYSVIDAAFTRDIALADYVDIGIAQYRAPLDLEWLDWVITALGELPANVMHVEAVLWSCLAMRMGGGYLDSTLWRCWENSQFKRIRSKLGATPAQMLALEDFSRAIAFHAGGAAKYWLATPGSEEQIKQLAALPSTGTASGKALHPFVPFSAKKFEWLKKRARTLEALGYYRFIGTAPPGALEGNQGSARRASSE
jgi:hypothetical protein